MGEVSLHDVEFAIPGDRIVAWYLSGRSDDCRREGTPFRGSSGTYGIKFKAASRMGAEISCSPEGILVEMNRRPIPVSFATGPYPAFSTDLQPVMMAAGCCCRREKPYQGDCI